MAVKIASRGEVFCYCATTSTRSWSATIKAPTRAVAILDIFSRIQSDLGALLPIRMLLNLPADSAVWQHTNDFAALGCLIERARLDDQPLMTEAGHGLTTLIATTQQAISSSPITVATDGSVRRTHSGYGWLATDGRHGLHAWQKASLSGHAVLFTELAAINAAVRAIKTHPLIVLSDSNHAIALVEEWKSGHDTLPAGYPETLYGKPSPLVRMRTRIHEHRDRLTLHWVKAHRGQPLNEGADALARLATRYSRGDSGLTEEQYVNRADSLARSFADWHLQDCA